VGHSCRFRLLQSWRALVLAGLIATGNAAWAQETERAAVPQQAAIDTTLPPLERGKALAGFAAGLVRQAESGKAHATSFRIDVAYYRETLRDLVKDNEQHRDSAPLPKPLIMDMVRMAALLQSAAQCQTGRYIVCPPDLMTQLHRQQDLIERGIVALGATR